MVKANVMFQPAAGLVMVEVVDKKQALKIHLPDSAKKKNDMVDLVVAAVGEGVTQFEPGDVVMCAPTKDTFRMDVGAGERSYLFHKEADILGKFGV